MAETEVSAGDQSKISKGGFCRPEIDEDISTEGLLRGAPAPRRTQVNDA
jgi:hypothetical protein